ncbi:MAG: hypothetical protein C6P35_12355 [Cohnella sp.]|uniref:hypothetical protein n=1 Tax=Cohnella sp. TaxID=1883426 RepID=UPI000E3824B0|nr:hypothetical protein [Cohnella sp.]REK64810.1 MAG: hypothetical protein C6P35_12355 [Cohnella sp.]
MSRLALEWEIKLSLLASIARSQEALARMLESAADVTEADAGTAAAIREHVRVLSNMQRALLGTATGGTWRPPKQGTAAAPWLSAKKLRPNRTANPKAGGMRV